MIQPHYGPFLGFAGEGVETRGYVDLMTTFGQDKISRSFIVRYLIVDADTSYFALIGSKMLNELGAIVSTLYLKTDQKQTWQYYAESLKVDLYPTSIGPGKSHFTFGGSS